MREAKSRLSELVRAVEERGETVILCRDGKPAARLVPADSDLVDHFKKDDRLRVVFHEDPSMPVSAEAWPEEYR